MKSFFFPLSIIICLVVLTSSCKKNSFITSPDAQLTISADTLKYDTVFTSIGSVTKSFKISNVNSQKLKLTRVKLMGGNSSPFRININGQATTEVDDLEMEANDSIYVFVSVTINPNLSSLPFIISDSILVSYNGNNIFVQLQAFGQNANFLRNRVITGNVTWANNLPYVILGSIRIDSSAVLTIQPGCRIYSHADAPFIVDGTLVVNGTKPDSVIFTGDRLDADYKDLPASWPGIYFRGSSRNNVLKYALIKNAYQAVVAEKPSSNAPVAKLILHQCIIDNAYDAGLLGVNTSLQADNSLITNCGSNIVLSYGGEYNLTHCTVASFSTLYINHHNPVMQVSNAALQNGMIVTASLNAVFRNCIFWGEAGQVDDEVPVNKQGATSFSVLFDHSLYRAMNDPANSTLTACIKNQYPSFDSIDVYRKIFDFHITKNAAAPGINKGNTITQNTRDLDNKLRTNIPDLGCYEK